MKTEFRKIILNTLRIAIILTSFLPLTAYAQKGLNIAPYFDGRYNKDPKVTSVTYRGDIIHDGDEGLYRSLIFELPHNAINNIEKAVHTDSKQAISKSIINKGGQALLLCYTFSPIKKKSPLREVIYKRAEKKAYLIYIESYASLDELRNAFRK